MIDSHFTRELRGLDASTDAKRIVELDTCHEFAFDTSHALELALFRSFAVPTIAELLDRTGEFYARPQRRYDDTETIIRLILQHGYDSPVGAEALHRMNRIHGRFEISNDDYLYVLSTFVLEPIRWNARFGWRPMFESEKQSLWIVWREIGRRMGIRGLPASLEELDTQSREYERDHFRPTQAAARVARATRDLFLSWLPRPLRGLGVQAVYALLDEPVRRAFSFPDPSPAVRAGVETVLRAHARALAMSPMLRRPRRVGEYPVRSHPDGFTIDQLGPPVT